MRLLTFSVGGQQKPGALVGEDGVADLAARMGAASRAMAIRGLRLRFGTGQRNCSIFNGLNIR